MAVAGRSSMEKAGWIGPHDETRQKWSKTIIVRKQITCYQQRASFESQLIFWNIFFDYDDVVTTTHYWLQQRGMQPRVVRCSWCLSLDWVGRNRIGPRGGPSWPVHQPSAPFAGLWLEELSSQIATRRARTTPYVRWSSTSKGGI